MEIYILNDTFEKIALINEADSILWNPQFSNVGYCEIHTRLDIELLNILKKGYYIKRFDDEMVCEIVKRTIETSVEQGDYLTIFAPDIKSILNRRIVWNTINFKGKVCDFIKKVIDDNIISPKTSARKITNFIFDNSNFNEFTETITYATEHENVLNLITEVCNDYGYGFKVTLNDTNQFVFKLLKKVDKSQISSNEYVEFSNEYSNIISSNYEESDESYKNVSLVGGEKKDNKQLFADYGNATGLDRREVYNDSGVSQTYTDDNGVERTYTDEEYKNVLNNIAKLKLLDNRKTEHFTGEVDTIDTYIYKKDYNIGDIVRVINEYGLEAPATIVGVIESEDVDNGYVVEPQFEY